MVGWSTTYDPAGNRTTTTLPNGIAGNFTYDALNRGEQNIQGGTLSGFYGSFQPYYGRPMLWGDYYAAVVDVDP